MFLGLRVQPATNLFLVLVLNILWSESLQCSSSFTLKSSMQCMAMNDVILMIWPDFTLLLLQWMLEQSWWHVRASILASVGHLVNCRKSFENCQNTCSDMRRLLASAWGLVLANLLWDFSAGLLTAMVPRLSSIITCFTSPPQCWLDYASEWKCGGGLHL